MASHPNVCRLVWGDMSGFLKVMKIFAREAALGNYGMKILPLVNTDRKGGAFPIMLKQPRRAIGVTIVRGNANLKLARLYYVRATSEEAAATCRANHTNSKWRPGQNSRASWYMNRKGMEPSNSSGMDMISVYIKCTWTPISNKYESNEICKRTHKKALKT